MRRALYLISALFFVLAGAACNSNAAGGSPQPTVNVDKDKLVRFVTRFLDVSIGPNNEGRNYILVAQAPENINSRLPRGSDVIGTVVDTNSSQTQSLVDIPLPQNDVIGQFRTNLQKEGYQEKGFGGGAPDLTSTSGPFLFCSQDNALIAIAYDPNTAREGFTSVLFTTVGSGAAGSPCAPQPVETPPADNTQVPSTPTTTAGRPEATAPAGTVTP